MASRKILYSPGFGAGWVSWMRGPKEKLQWALTYQPIIDFLEAGGKFTDEDEGGGYKPTHPVLRKMHDESIERWGEDEGEIYFGGAAQLCVAEVDGPVRIHEYDGNEDYEVQGDYEWWL